MTRTICFVATLLTFATLSFGPHCANAQPPSLGYGEALRDRSRRAVDVAVAAQQNKVPPKVYVLILGFALDSAIGDGVKASRQIIEKLLNDAFDPAEMQISTVGFPGDSERLLTDGINRAIDAVNSKVRKDTDVVLCFMLSHGGYDPARQTPQYEYGHLFSTEDRFVNYPRSSLSERLRTANPKLTVLLSDACSVNVRPKAAPAPAPPTVAAGVQKSKSLRYLLHHHTGIVSINGASLNQFSFYDKTAGGLFIQAFRDTIMWLETEPNPERSWQELFPFLVAHTGQNFDEAFPGGCPYYWNNTVNPPQVATLSPSDPRTQKSLTPMAYRPLTAVIEDDEAPVQDPNNPTGGRMAGTKSSSDVVLQAPKKIRDQLELARKALRDARDAKELFEEDHAKSHRDKQKAAARIAENDANKAVAEAKRIFDEAKSRETRIQLALAAAKKALELAQDKGVETKRIADDLENGGSKPPGGEVKKVSMDPAAGERTADKAEEPSGAESEKKPM